jgi:hypothetical protein
MSLASTLRRALLTIGIVAVLAFAAYGVYWHVTANKLRDGLAPWAAARRAEGYTLRWDKVEIGGFPARFRFRFTGARLGAQRPVPIAFDVSSLDVWAEPWNLHHWRFSTGDVAQVADPLGTVGFSLDHLDGSAQFDVGDPLLLDVAVAGASGAGLARGFAIGTATAHIEVPAAPPRDHRDTALDAVLELGAVKLPQSVPGFGDTVTDLAFSTDLKGGLPPGPLEPALTAWRDAGGTIELRYFRLRWGGLLIDANGTLALDGALQPEGALSAEITGQDAAVDLAVTTGALQPADTTLAKAVLGLLAKPGPSGAKAITVPLTLQQDRIYLGAAAIASIPRISWE